MRYCNDWALTATFGKDLINDDDYDDDADDDDITSNMGVRIYLRMVSYTYLHIIKRFLQQSVDTHSKKVDVPTYPTILI